jgi:hypothetical protein
MSELRALLTFINEADAQVEQSVMMLNSDVSPVLDPTGTSR